MDASFSAEEHFRRGEEALGCGQKELALQHFGAAHKLDGTSARYRSHYGLALGLAERRLDRALELCRSAAREEFFQPLHYLNLARLHLAFGFKAEAIRYLRRGLMIDPDNDAISSQLSRLGVRRRPPLVFLRRQHVLNRWIGRLIGRVGAIAEPELTPFGV
jgi:tetratricopeptide (TPR) repeat protein